MFEMLMELGALTIKSAVFGLACIIISTVFCVGLVFIFGGWVVGGTLIGEAFGFLPWLMVMAPIALIFFGFVAWLLKG